jgi:hypothetical protein
MRISATAFCFLVFASAAFAQSDRGAISGTVFDSNGLIVAGTQVQAKGTNGDGHKAPSSPQGKYTIADLPPGTYQITVAVGGLKPYAKSNVMVQAGKTVALDIRMEDTTQLSTLGEDRFAVAADSLKHKPPSGPAPRVEGKPDLSGVWWSPATVDPGKPEFTAWAEQVAKERSENLRKENPQAHCLPSAILRRGPIYEFVQGREFMVEISDDDSPGFFQIYLDGRKHPEDPNPAWYGDNVGHWEGDTLVVDRVGFDDRAYLDQDQHPHGPKLHVIERYRRVDMGHLETEVTVEDPKTLAKPWTFKRMSELAPTEQIYEFICPENNRDTSHLVGK